MTIIDVVQSDISIITLLIWILGFLGTIIVAGLSFGLPTITRVITRNTTVIADVKEILSAKSQKIEDMDTNCKNQHGVINERLSKHTREIENLKDRTLIIETNLHSNPNGTYVLNDKESPQ